MSGGQVRRNNNRRKKKKKPTYESSTQEFWNRTIDILTRIVLAIVERL